MGDRILLCGQNGAGKSTLGKALAKRLGCPFLDIEDYYFDQQGAYPYGQSRTKAEVAALLRADAQKFDAFVLAAVTGDYGDELIERLTLAVLLRIPKALGLERVRSRSFQKFGARMLPGGELYESEESFFQMVERRALTGAEDWLKTTGIPWIALDGAAAIMDNADRIIGYLGNEG